MKRFVMLLVAGMAAVMLSACGDNAPQKPAETTTDAAVVEQQAPATEDATPASTTETTTTETTTPADTAPAAE